MKIAVAAIFAIEFCVCAVAMAQKAETPERSLTFQGTTYVLSSVNVTGQTITDEYVPTGDTLENWTTLIGVRQFRSAHELKDVLPKYFAMIKPVLYTKAEILKKDNVEVTDEVTLLLWLKDPNNSYLEYDLHRFIRTPNGVIAYQFAQRIPYEKRTNVTAIMTKQASRIQELNDASFPVYDK